MKNIENINKKLRKDVFRFIQEQMDQGFSLKEAIERYCNYLYLLQESKDPYAKIKYQAILGMLYLDTYKLVKYEIRKNSQSLDDLEILNILEQWEDFDDLCAEISCSPGLLETMIEHSYCFSEKTLLGKVLIIKSLTQEEHYEAAKMDPQHIQDIQYYHRYVNEKFIYKNYLALEKNAQHYEFYAGKQHAVENIISFIRDLYWVDRKNTMDLLKRIIIRDYEFSKYFISKNLFSEEVPRLEAQIRIEFIEDPEMSLEEVIDLYLEDPSFFQSLISSFLEEMKSLEQSSMITEQELEKYCEKKLSKQVKQKLALKKPLS